VSLCVADIRTSRGRGVKPGSQGKVCIAVTPPVVFISNQVTVIQGGIINISVGYN
jgi:hypothetical protein